MAARKPKAEPQAQDSPAAPPSEADPITEAAPAKEGPSPASDAPADQPVEQVPALFVRTRRGIKSRRRAGFRFGREGMGIALEALSAEEVAALKADPALEVEECTFPLTDDEAEQ